MQFKDIKPDYSLYLFDRDKLKYSEVKVASVSAPRFDSKVGMPACMVVDITVEENGKPLTYPFNQDLSKAYMGTTLVATSKADVVTDIKAIKASSENALKAVPIHEERVTTCNQLLQDLDTEYKEKQATEERFSQIETSIGDIKSMLTKLISK